MFCKIKCLKALFLYILLFCIATFLISNSNDFYESFTAYFYDSSNDFEHQLRKINDLDKIEMLDGLNDVEEFSFIRRDCTMNSCFDFGNCKNFKIYVYPDIKGLYVSSLLKNILLILRKSKYFTDNPNEACLFIPSLDTLHRDSLSPNFDKQLDSIIQSLPFWHDNGSNHLLFNFYAGTWPNYYEEEFNMTVKRALLAKASLSTNSYRQDYDISMPLIHSTHPVYSDRRNCALDDEKHVHKKYLLVFKGKRYLHGVGSYSRNMVHLLHNGVDIVLLTTCQHGQNWRQFADRRCSQDMEEYSRFDYDELMRNSRFCLVPRGRRLGSYRFLEALRVGCIPVMLSNDWILPFSEVIDWREAVVWGDERLVMQIPDIIRQIPISRVVQYRARIRFLWNTYFSSVERIMQTVIEIIRDRVSEGPRNKLTWNIYPGGLTNSITQPTSLHDILYNSTLSNHIYC